MSEEVKNASKDVARSMVLSILINGALALSMLIAVLFSSNLNEAASDSLTLYPFVQIFSEATDSNAGTTIMTMIIVVLQFASAVGAMAAASRMTWSFARDRALPFSKVLSTVCLL